MKSEKARPIDSKKIEEKLEFTNGPNVNVIIEKNKLKKRGINIKANGIKILKFSSKVSENVIQCMPLK